MSFRKKILFSYILIFLLFTILLYPIVTTLIGNIQERNLRHQAKELIIYITSAPTFENLIDRLQYKERYIFFRVSLIDAKDGFIYDSHGDVASLEGKLLYRYEIDKAFTKGDGYEVRYSPLFGQEMAYMAVHFTYAGRELVLRTAFPFGQLQDLNHDLNLTFLILGIAILLLFSLLSWFILHYLTRPVQQIIQAIRPYQLGLAEHIPKIPLGKQIRPQDEFGQLADTLNSLTNRIESQIASLTQEKNEKSAILESLVEGVVVVDGAMNVIYMNRMAEVFLSMQEQELAGKSFSLTNQPECEQLIIDAQKKGQPVALVLKPKRQQKRFIDAVAVPRGEGGAILVLQDKTSLHKVIEMGKDFIANASHELKTPITIIRGFAETLHDHPELSRDVSLEITKKIVSNCGRMETLVKNLLTLAAVDEGLPRSRLQECDLVDLAKQAKMTVRSVHAESEILIETVGEPPFHILGDSDLLFQAILNLLDNAVKYSPYPARVTISIENLTNQFLIKVSDRGIGIPAEELDRIFERFYAVDKSHSRSLGGSGLGLSIVERIVEKHKGTIDVESTPGEGTTFLITLPLQQES
ncbi:MAG: Sensor histidine kinase ResE [Chlamydiae bacterium]|nr:Sensor histidine kinase ResE [Chlamydiota bacterium]